MDTTYSLSDIAAATGNEGMGGMGGWWMIILFALIFGGNGGLFGNRNQAATTDEVAAGFNFNGINSKLNDITAAINSEGRTTDNAICQIGYQNLQNTNALASQLAECCCTTQRAVDSVKFDMANYSAATNATVTAGIQKVLDKMCADQTAALQARVQQLELQSALCGIPRTSPYGYGIYAYPTMPACGCGANI